MDQRFIAKALGENTVDLFSRSSCSGPRQWMRSGSVSVSSARDGSVAGSLLVAVCGVLAAIANMGQDELRRGWLCALLLQRHLIS